jgi:LuxR family maltose regulon positive regulatory protein
LQLAALALQQHASHIPTFIADFTGSHRYVFDYLADEVFQQQPTAVQTFLMETAILPRLCGSLSDAVTGQNNGQAMLEHLDQIDLFLIRLDSNRRWYRYHHLFGDFLRERLDRATGPTDRVLLHQRARAWFEQHGLIREAIDHALSAQAWGDAIRCFAPFMASPLFYEYYLDWPRWLAALPDTALMDEPDMCLRLAWILALIGQAEATERLLTLAEAAWHSANNQSQVGAVLVCRALALGFKGELARGRSLVQQALIKLTDELSEQRAIATWLLGNSELLLGHIGTAMELITAAHKALAVSREAFFARASSLLMIRTYQLQGKLQHSAALYNDLIRNAAGATHLEQPALYLFLGLIHYEWNNLAIVQQLLQEGIVVGQRTGRGRYWPGIYTTLAQVHWAQGDIVQAQALIEQALIVARSLENTSDIAKAEALQAWLWLTQDKLSAAQNWLTRALSVSDTISYEHQAKYLMLARIRIAQERQAHGSGHMNAVMPLLNQLLQLADADLRVPDQITILALIALAHAAQGEQHQAMTIITTALTMAMPERYVRSFVDEGTPLHSLIAASELWITQNAADNESAALLAYINRVLAAFPHSAPAVPSQTSPMMLLSEREQAVLLLIASGHSVQEIAIQLVISAHTARTHIKNIYAKLDVHTRLQAVERARTLHLLP